MPRPALAVDVDGSLFKSSLLEKAVARAIDRGLFDAQAFNEVEDRRRQWQDKNNEGVYKSYVKRLVGQFVTQIAGIEVSQFKEEVIDWVIAEHQVRRFAFPRRLIRALQQSHEKVAISGSPEFLVSPFLSDLPIDRTYGATFEQVDGYFTGVATPVGNKADILRRLEEASVITKPGSVAMGDTVSDEPMLDYVSQGGYPIMFNASRTLTNRGKRKGWLRVGEVKDQITALEPDKSYGYREVHPDVIIGRIKRASTSI